MKKIFVLLVFFVCCQTKLNAQFNFDGTISFVVNYPFKETDIEGSPYSKDEFVFAEVAGIEKKVKLRYNSHNDLFEIQNGDKEIFELNKNELYATIVFEKTGETYKLVKLKDEIGHQYGYMLEFFNSEKLKVLKREKSISIEGQPAANGYVATKPPMFVKVPSEFYLKLNNGAYDLFPNSKEKLIEYFPTKEYEINKFFREFSPDFKDEKGIASIADFCSKL